MELEKGNFFTRYAAEGDVILHTFKAIFISLTLILGAILILIHLHHTSLESTNHSPPPLDSPAIYTNSYIFTVSLAKATEQLQDAMSLILSSSDVDDIDTEVAWKNCSESVLSGWGEIQDALDHVMMNPFTETPGDEQRGELTRQMIAADGFIEACLDDLVESTAARELRAKLLLAKVYLSGRGDFLTSYYDDIWNRVVVVAWAITLGNLSYIMFCGVQLLFVLYMFHKLSKFRST